VQEAQTEILNALHKHFDESAEYLRPELGQQPERSLHTV